MIIRKSAQHHSDYHDTVVYALIDDDFFTGGSDMDGIRGGIFCKGLSEFTDVLGSYRTELVSKRANVEKYV